MPRRHNLAPNQSSPSAQTLQERRQLLTGMLAPPLLEELADVELPSGNDLALGFLNRVVWSHSDCSKTHGGLRQRESAMIQEMSANKFEATIFNKTLKIYTDSPGGGEKTQ